MASMRCRLSSESERQGAAAHCRLPYPSAGLALAEAERESARPYGASMICSSPAAPTCENVCKRLPSPAADSFVVAATSMKAKPVASGDGFNARPTRRAAAAPICLVAPSGGGGAAARSRPPTTCAGSCTRGSAASRSLTYGCASNTMRRNAHSL